jgi:N-terminal acetyltransferase B complex catalytic subunit
MSFVRQMRATDIMHFATCNLDSLTETYNNDYYLDYIQRWPQFCKVVESWDGGIEAYSTITTRFLPHFLL